MFYRPWQNNSPNIEQARTLVKQTNLPLLVCNVLASRGQTSEEEVRTILNEDAHLSDAMLLKNMDKAVERILRAIDNGERITVFGDYDVDGVTATALLFLYLDSVGADVYCKLPNREDDGYGLNTEAVQLMANKGVNLIITVDNGVGACEAIAFANTLGVDVVVTDHHLPPEILPNAVAIVNPNLEDDQSPFKSLSGAGVAFKLCAALEGCSPDEMLSFYGDFAAIGTIADLMPLVGENRQLVKAGLALLQHTERAGIAALLDVCGFANKDITAENVSFGLAPRLNAAGRIDSATAALELLLCEDEEEAAERAARLNEQNIERQKIEQDIAQTVYDTIQKDDSYHADRILVVAAHGLHLGVIGIVASRVVERFGKPAIIISLDETGEGHGSGRSIPGVSLYDAMASCESFLLRFGGHAGAAGLSVFEKDIPLLRKTINEWALSNHPLLRRPPLCTDAAVRLDSLTPADVRALDTLAPFGRGNSAPLFLIEKATVEVVYPVSEGKHCRIRLRQGTASMYAVMFGTSPEALCYHVGDLVDAVLSLSVFDGKTGEMLSARITELRPAALDEAYLEGAALYDAFSCGVALTDAQKQSITPARADTVAVYRALTSAPNGIQSGDLRPLFAKLGAQNAGKTLVSLAALEELCLIEKSETGGVPRYKAVPQAAKQDLSSAPILRRLEG